MLCPKCNVESETRFCRQCGLDLGVYQELSALRVELESLRLQLPKFAADPSPRPVPPRPETAKVGERDAYVVEATSAGGDPDKMYFDAESGLLVRAVNHRHTPDGVAVFQAEVEDYKDVDGIKLPFTVHQSSAESAFTIKFTEIHHNLQLADGQFAKPAAEPAAK